MKCKIHTYKRINLTPKWRRKKEGIPGTEVLACTGANCQSTLRLEMAIGKLCACCVCKEPMIITRALLLKVNIRCNNCIQRKNKSDINKMGEFLDNL